MSIKQRIGIEEARRKAERAERPYSNNWLFRVDAQPKGDLAEVCCCLVFAAAAIGAIAHFLPQFLMSIH